jgi:hypothetical protein
MTAGVTTADACAAACASLPGCNAFNWCGRAGGCGSGCKAYVKQHPPLKGDPEGLADKNQKLPILVSRRV